MKMFISFFTSLQGGGFEKLFPLTRKKFAKNYESSNRASSKPYAGRRIRTPERTKRQTPEACRFDHFPIPALKEFSLQNALIVCSNCLIAFASPIVLSQTILQLLFQILAVQKSVFLFYDACPLVSIECFFQAIQKEL